jgi:hypothetical protein
MILPSFQFRLVPKPVLEGDVLVALPPPPILRVRLTNHLELNEKDWYLELFVGHADLDPMAW